MEKYCDLNLKLSTIYQIEQKLDLSQIRQIVFVCLVALLLENLTA